MSLARLGSELLLVEGKSVEVVPRLAAQLAVERVVAMRWVEPFARERGRRVGQALEAQGIPFTLIAQRQFFKSALGLPEPWASPRETPHSHSHSHAQGQPGDGGDFLSRLRARASRRAAARTCSRWRALRRRPARC